MSPVPQKQDYDLTGLIRAGRWTDALGILKGLHARPQDEMRQIVDDMHVDDRMRLLDELPEPSWQQLVNELSESERELTERLAAYPPNSAGRYLTPQFVA